MHLSRHTQHAFLLVAAIFLAILAFALPKPAHAESGYYTTTSESTTTSSTDADGVTTSTTSTSTNVPSELYTTRDRRTSDLDARYPYDTTNGEHRNDSDAVRSGFEGRPGAWAHADALASASGLDMREHWTATADSYLGRVTKARILEAVAEGASPEAAQRLADLKKDEMAEAAEAALKGKGWLPPLLRTAGEGATVPLAAE